MAFVSHRWLDTTCQAATQQIKTHGTIEGALCVLFLVLCSRKFRRIWARFAFAPLVHMADLLCYLHSWSWGHLGAPSHPPPQRGRKGTQKESFQSYRVFRVWVRALLLTKGKLHKPHSYSICEMGIKARECLNLEAASSTYSHFGKR